MKNEDKKVLETTIDIDVDSRCILELSEELAEVHQRQKDLHGDLFIKCVMSQEWYSHEDMNIVLTSLHLESDEEFKKRKKIEENEHKRELQRIHKEEEKKKHNKIIEDKIRELKRKIK